ncbi:MAG: type IX secretion system membrane protein PorP/SprF [Saprospiraceae bacterium]|nr:type IX secretion system membrane protein PorP/SprF [Saprospiraceae bacterium]
MNLKNELNACFALTVEILLLSVFSVSAQLIPISYNLNNRTLINISAPHTEKIQNNFSPVHELVILNRTQWTGLDQGLKWNGISYDINLDENTRVGCNIYHESFGPLKSLFVAGNYVYNLNINSSNQISGGASIQYNLNQLNTSKASVTHPVDPLLENNPSTSFISFSPAVCYSGVIPSSDIGLVFGASYHNALNIEIGKFKAFTPLQVLVFNGSLIKFLSPGFRDVSSIEGGVVYRKYSSISDDVQLYLKYNWHGKLNIRPGLRFGIAQEFGVHGLQMDIGFPLAKIFKLERKIIDLNYVFELPFPSSPAAFGTTHEISLSVLF